MLHTVLDIAFCLRCLCFGVYSTVYAVESIQLSSLYDCFVWQNHISTYYTLCSIASCSTKYISIDMLRWHSVGCFLLRSGPFVSGNCQVFLVVLVRSIVEGRWRHHGPMYPYGVDVPVARFMELLWSCVKNRQPLAKMLILEAPKFVDPQVSV